MKYRYSRKVLERLRRSRVRCIVRTYSHWTRVAAWEAAERAGVPGGPFPELYAPRWGCGSVFAVACFLGALALLCWFAFYLGQQQWPN